MITFVVNATLGAILASMNGGTLPDGYVVSTQVPVLPAPPAPCIVRPTTRNARRLALKRSKK